MADTVQMRSALLFLAFLQPSYGTNEDVFVSSISTALLVVGLITLVFGIAGVIGGVIIYKYLVKRYQKTSDLPNEVEVPNEVELQAIPAGHMYEQVESSTSAVRNEEPRPYEVAISERPPIPVPSEPEEMGFAVTAHVQDPTVAEQELVTPNPHYITVDEKHEKQSNTEPDYENHDPTKLEDHTHGAYNGVPGGNASLEGAVNFCDREEIEGELIDEIDYQNVTVVLTRVKNDEKNRAHFQEDIFQTGLATAAVEWQDSGCKIDEGKASNFQNAESNEIPSVSQQTQEFPDVNEVYDDVSKVASNGLYQNFGQEQSNDVRVTSDESLYDDTQKVSHDTQEEDGVDDYENFDGVEELYINTPSLHMRAAKDEAEFDYENMSPNQFRT